MKKHTIQQMKEKEAELFAQYTLKSIAAFLRCSAGDGEAKKHLIKESVLFLKKIQILWKLSGISEEKISHELQERMRLSDKLLEKGIRARKDGSYRSTKLP